MNPICMNDISLHEGGILTREKKYSTKKSFKVYTKPVVERAFQMRNFNKEMFLLVYASMCIGVGFYVLLILGFRAWHESPRDQSHGSP